MAFGWGGHGPPAPPIPTPTGCCNQTDFTVSMSNSHLTAVPEGTGQGAGPNMQYLAEAGEGSTVPGEGIARGEDTGQPVGTGQLVGTDQPVAGTGEAAHLDLWK